MASQRTYAELSERMMLIDMHPDHPWTQAELDEVNFYRENIAAYNRTQDIPKFSEAKHGDKINEDERALLTGPRPIDDPIHAIAAANAQTTWPALLYLTSSSTSRISVVACHDGVA